MVVPELKDIKADIRKLKVEIKRLDEKIDSGLARLDEKIDSKHNEAISLFKRLDEKIASRHNEVMSEIRRLDERINSLETKLEIGLEFRERFKALELKVETLAKSLNK